MSGKKAGKLRRRRKSDDAVIDEVPFICYYCGCKMVRGEFGVTVFLGTPICFRCYWTMVFKVTHR